MARYRKKPLVQFEHGTKIYSPTSGEPYYRIVAPDPLSSKRLTAKRKTEDLAREQARDFEDRIANAKPLREVADENRTIDRLAGSYVDHHLSGLSLRYREKQDYLLRSWILPRIGQVQISAWTAADSTAVIAHARQAGLADSTIQDIGSALRGLVTHARRLRWLSPNSEDPMWMVRYSKRASVQGATSLYIAPSTLPTDEDCAALFAALEDRGDHQWATAMKLVHRSGLRWGELTALRACDLVFDPQRIVWVRQAVEQGSTGPATLKPPKNGKIRTTFFPKSMSDELEAHADSVRSARGPEALLFATRRGGIVRRSSFQQVWIQAADAAGWPMDTPLKRTAGYGTKNKGWRWTGAARWTPHDLRHVAACWMLFDVGLDPAIVADKLGHADPAFTIKRYVGVRGDADETANRMTDDW